MDIDDFKKYFKERVVIWHKNFSFPLKAEMLEEVLSRTFFEDMKLKGEWKKGGHQPGIDIDVYDEDSYSVKSGKETTNQIKISSSRTTTYKTLEEKINFYKNVENTFTKYFLFSKKETDLNLRYTIYIIPKEKISIDNIEWKDSNNWQGEDKENNYYFSIVESMSHQIWITLNKDYISDSIIDSFTFNIKKNNNGLEDFILKET